MVRSGFPSMDCDHTWSCLFSGWYSWSPTWSSTIILGVEHCSARNNQGQQWIRLLPLISSEWQFHTLIKSYRWFFHMVKNCRFKHEAWDNGGCKHGDYQLIQPIITVNSDYQCTVPGRSGAKYQTSSGIASIDYDFPMYHLMKSGDVMEPTKMGKWYM